MLARPVPRVGVEGQHNRRADDQQANGNGVPGYLSRQGRPVHDGVDNKEDDRRQRNPRNPVTQEVMIILLIGQLQTGLKTQPAKPLGNLRLQPGFIPLGRSGHQ